MISINLLNFLENKLKIYANTININIDIQTRIIEKNFFLFKFSLKKIYPRRTLIIGIIK